MKKFRKIVPRIAMALCASMLLSMAGYAATVGTPEPESLHEINQLAFQSVQVDAQSLFTRQSADSETESEDETLREDSRTFSILVSRELSISVSSSAQLTSAQLPPVHVPGGCRCILYSRLII